MEKTNFSVPYHSSSELLPGQEMSVKDLDFYALLRRQSSDGSLYFNQRRAVLFDVEAMGALRQQLVETLGQEIANGVLMRFGYSQGYKDADTLADTFNWKSEADWLAAGPTLHMLEGIVQVEVESLEFNRDAGQFNMRGNWHNSYEAEEHLKRFGKSETPVCFSLAGYASGYATRFLGRDVLAIETKCVAKGDDHCAWEVKPLEAWGKEAEPHLHALQQVNIPDKLATTQQLEKQTTQLTALNQISAEINLATSTEQVFAVTATKTPQIVNANRVSITLLNPDARTVKVFALNDESGAIPQESQLQINKSSGIGRAIKNQQVVVNHKIKNSKTAENLEMAQHGFYSSMVAPLITGQGVIGTLNVASKTPDAYDEQSKNVLMQLASMLAAAIEKQRLIEQAEQRAEELEETTTFLDSILDNIPAMVFVKEAEELRFVRRNKAAQELVGFKNEDMIGKNHYDFFPKEEAEFFTAKDREVLNGGKLVDIPEEPIQTAGGEIRWLHTRKVPMIGTDGKPKYLLGISEDITERKQADEDLKESQSLYQTSIDGLPQNVYRIDKEGRIIFGNKAYQETLGMPPEEFLGKTAYDFFPKDLADKYTADDQLVMKTEEVLDVVEAHKVPATGEINYVRVVKTPVKDSSGNVAGVQATFWEVTQRVQAEQALGKRAGELEAVAEVGAAVTTILDTTELLQTVADLTKERFDLYHAHIYLLNETGDTLNLAAGAGKTGQQMVSEGWSIPFDREQSLVARAAHIRQGVIVNDVRQESGYFQNPMLPDTRSELAVPIIVGDKLLGVLDVQSEIVDHFTNEDVYIQSTLAGQVAAALQNAGLFEQTQKSAKRLQTLNEVATLLSQTATVDEVLKVAATKIGDVIVTDRASLTMLNRDGDKLELFALKGAEGAIPVGIQLPVKGTAVGWAVTNNKIFVTHNAQESDFMDIKQLAGQGIQSTMYVPMVVGGKVFGTLNVGRMQAAAFNDDDKAILAQVASMLASIIENRRFLEQAQTRARREQLLREVTSRIRGSADVDTVMRTAVQEVGRALGRQAFVYLGNEENGKDMQPSTTEQEAQND